MPSDGTKKIFLSYARVDSVDLAQRLRTDLAGQGYDPWLDTDRIAGGAVWTVGIEVALDAASVVLALLSHGSYVSEICRAEQLRALRKGKVVIPILARQPTDIPLHLEAKNYRDLSTAAAYTERFPVLLKDIESGNGVALKDEFRHTYVTAPPLAENFIARPEALAALRDAVMRERVSANLPVTALIGMGGIGKTQLALALCRDEVIQQAFPDGVVWITAGKDPAYDLTTRLREAGKALQDDVTLYDNELGARNQFQTTIRAKAALIVVDDVWSGRDIEPFRGESARSALLFTTRDASIAAVVGAHDHAAGSLTRAESRAVLARWAGLEPARLPAEAEDLVTECGYLPLALAMVGATLRGKQPILWKRQLGFLRSADLDKIKAQFPGYPYPSLFRAIEVSVDELDAVTRERYLALAVLPDGMAAHPAIQQTLWRTDEGEAAETAAKLIELSLAQPDGEGILLHGLQLDYAGAQYPDREALALIRGAVRLSRLVLAADPSQFSAQVAGRLLTRQDQPGVAAFIERLRKDPPQPWLRLITPTLTPPGGPMLLMIKGDESYQTMAAAGGGLSALAATSTQILAAPFDGNEIKIWDAVSGDLLKTLKGHSGRVTRLLADGQRAISSSKDNTIRIWNLDSGEPIRTIDCAATALALTADGQRLIAGTEAGVLNVFEIATGIRRQELTGCDARVDSIAVADGGAVVATTAAKTYLWHLSDAGSPRVFDDFKGQMSVLPGTGRVASIDGKTLTVWDWKTGAVAYTSTRQGFAYDQVAALPDGRSVICCAMIDAFEIVDTVTGNVRSKLPNPVARVAFLALTPDGRRAVTAVNSGEIRVWDLESKGAPSEPAIHHTRPVRKVAITDGGLYAVSIGYDGTVVWDLSDGNPVHGLDQNWCSNPMRDSYIDSLPGPWDRLRACLPGGRLATLNGNALQITKSGEIELPDLPIPADPLEVLRATSDGRLVVTGSGTGVGRIFDLPQRKEVASLEGHTEAISDLLIEESERRIVTGSMDGTLKVWDLDTGRLQCTLTGHTGNITAVTCFPGSGLIVSTAIDQSLRIWDPATGAALASFTVESALMCCAAAPDNRTIVAAEFMGTVHILVAEGLPAVASQTGPGWSSEPNRPPLGDEDIQGALQLQSEKEYGRAERLFRYALELRIFLRGLADSAVATAMNYLALLLIEQQRYAEAEPLLTTALMIYTAIFGPRDANVAANLMNLGYASAFQSKWQESVDYYREAVAILEENPQADTSMLGYARENFAQASTNLRASPMATSE